jgi:hypothetical protein
MTLKKENVRTVERFEEPEQNLNTTSIKHIP